MLILDPEMRARPYHILDPEDTRWYVIGICGKIFDIRPQGIDLVATVESDDLICGICLRKRNERTPLVVVDFPDPLYEAADEDDDSMGRFGAIVRAAEGRIGSAGEAIERMRSAGIPNAAIEEACRVRIS